MLVLVLCALSIYYPGMRQVHKNKRRVGVTLLPIFHTNLHCLPAILSAVQIKSLSVAVAN